MFSIASPLVAAAFANGRTPPQDFEVVFDTGQVTASTLLRT